MNFTQKTLFWIFTGFQWIHLFWTWNKNVDKILWRYDAVLHLTLRKMCPYSKLFWSVFSRIRTEYGEISIYIYLTQCKVNAFAHSLGITVTTSISQQIVKILQDREFKVINLYWLQNDAREKNISLIND